jgi:hypothetical protein
VELDGGQAQGAVQSAVQGSGTGRGAQDQGLRYKRVRGRGRVQNLHPAFMQLLSSKPGFGYRVKDL